MQLLKTYLLMELLLCRLWRKPISIRADSYLSDPSHSAQSHGHHQTRLRDYS